MRMDSAAILKRFFFCEQALIRAQAGWLPAVAPLDLKLTLPRAIWEDALAADALRQRVFELRYPSRLMEIGDDAPLVALFDAARHAPGALAFVAGVARVLAPALGQAYRAYLAVADDLGDGPTRRFLDLAAREKERQAAELQALLAPALHEDPMERQRSDAWVSALQAQLDARGGVSLHTPGGDADPPALPHAMPFSPAQFPARDPRFLLGRFYWPDNVEPSYPYGDGISLQLRSAISHLNEVWAVEAAGAILDAFAEPLGWQFVVDAARWVYDESHHALMGYTRLCDWGFQPRELPLGSYIYDSARDQDPLYRLGMLFFFETKNIGKKTSRAEAFAGMGDAASRHDMEFDWADESRHAAYGKRWLGALFALRGLPPDSYDVIRERCSALVQATVASATPQETERIRRVAKRLLARANELAVSGQASARD
jgi:hypothetical protein